MTPAAEGTTGQWSTSPQTRDGTCLFVRDREFFWTGEWHDLSVTFKSEIRCCQAIQDKQWARDYATCEIGATVFENQKEDSAVTMAAAFCSLDWGSKTSFQSREEEYHEMTALSLVCCNCVMISGIPTWKIAASNCCYQQLLTPWTSRLDLHLPSSFSDGEPMLSVWVASQ